MDLFPQKRTVLTYQPPLMECFFKLCLTFSIVIEFWLKSYWTEPKMSRTLNVILASTQTGCIGSGGSLPWEIPSDLIRFKRITTGGTLIVGRRTAESLPELQGRDLLIVSRSLSRDDPRVCRSFQEAVDRGSNGCRPLFVAGGAQIYNEVFKEHNQGLIDKIHYSLVDGEYPGDTHIAFPTHDFVIVSEEKAEGHVHYVLRPSRTGERQYLITMKSILTRGEHYRGRNGDTIQIFGETTLCFDLRDGFPLLTTKKMFFRGIAEELLFFLRGDTDTRLLEDKNVNIWKENTSRNFLDSVGKTNRREGVMGPMYGYQWRTYGAPYDEQKAAPEEGAEGYDQLRRVVEQISKEPNSRRILMTTYNPLQVEEGVLHPCHSIVLQFQRESSISGHDVLQS